MSVIVDIKNHKKVFIDINNKQYDTAEEVINSDRQNNLAGMAKRATANKVGEETQGEIKK